MSSSGLQRLVQTFLVSVFFCALIAPAEAQVRINEVAASNVGSHRDNFGGTSDWIELVNLGFETVDLEGYGISDDAEEPFKWVFPEALLEPNVQTVVYASDRDIDFYANDWNTVIEKGDLWRYFPGSEEPPADWFENDFDDRSWALGPSGFGFGDDDDETLVEENSVYLRGRLELTATQVADLKGVYMNVDIDDGMIALVNGVEVRRLGFDPGDLPRHDEFANLNAEALIYQGLPARGFLVENAANSPWVVGTNLIAIQAHNSTPDSDDLSVIPIISVGSVSEQPTGKISPYIRIPVSVLHTNFKLSAQGETIYLTRPNGVLEDQLETGRLYAEHSVGRLEEEPFGSRLGARYYFETPTPREPNLEEGRIGFSLDPEFENRSGYYERPFWAELRPQVPDVPVYYSLDGSEPTEEESNLYTGPISLDEGLNVVRLRSFQPGLWPSRTTSATYALDPSTSALPVLSMVADPDDFFDEETGIYVFGDEYEEEVPHFGANFWEDWERPFHVDFFEPDGFLGFSVDLGVKIHGGFSRANDQKSLRLHARGGYRDSSVNYRIFDETTVDEFERLIFRNAGQDWADAFCRDAVLHSIGSELGLEGQAYRPAVAFLNGDYWGIHNIREKLGPAYIESHFGYDEIDLLKNRATAEAGDFLHWNELLAFVRSNDMALDENYEYVRTQMDVENFIDYLALEIHFANSDWPFNNLLRWRPRVEGGRWRWILWDLDFTLGRQYTAGFDFLQLVLSTDPQDTQQWSNELMRGLFENPTFTRDFINRYADWMNTSLSAERLQEVTLDITDFIEPDIAPHRARWSQTVERWESERDVILDWVVARIPAARGDVIEQFGLAGGGYQLDLDQSPAGSGSIELAAITVDGPFSGSYFRQHPLTLTALPNPGFQFAGWSDPTLPQEPSIVIAPDEDRSITALFEPGGEIATVVIHEINYSSAADFDPGDWIELHNPGSDVIDVSGWVLKDDDDSHQLVLPEGTGIPGRGFVLLAADSEALLAKFPDVTVTAEFSFGFSGGGDAVRLFDSSGDLHDQVVYDDVAPWPTEPDGQGPTLELLDPRLDNSQPESWSASVLPHGTPGFANGSCSSINCVLREF